MLHDLALMDLQMPEMDPNTEACGICPKSYSRHPDEAPRRSDLDVRTSGRSALAAAAGARSRAALQIVARGVKEDHAPE
jgi:hypothetical protein